MHFSCLLDQLVAMNSCETFFTVKMERGAQSHGKRADIAELVLHRPNSLYAKHLTASISRHNLSDPSCGILHICSTQKIFQVSRFRAVIAFLKLLLRPESHTYYVESETVDVHQPPLIFRSSLSTLSRSRAARGWIFEALEQLSTKKSAP